MTKSVQQIELDILRIETNPKSYCGGEKAYYSGNRTYFTDAAQKKIDRLNKQLEKLLDEVGEEA